MYVCMYVCMDVWMYVCIYIYIYIHTYIHIYINFHRKGNKVKKFIYCASGHIRIIIKRFFFHKTTSIPFYFVINVYNVTKRFLI